MQRQIRQGDVLLVAVERPTSPPTRRTTRLVLAKGEMTGHAHVITAPLIEVWESEDGVIFSLSSEGVLVHEQHDPTGHVIAAPVTYQVVPQHELNLAGEWREVMD